MLQGICINTSYTAVLEKGRKYFLFPNGPSSFYVSKFPNEKAHTGCFRAVFFEITEENKLPAEPEAISLCLDPDKVYKATLIWKTPFYKSKLNQDYYLKPSKMNAFFYKDLELEQLAGCFPLHWFSGFTEVENISLESVIKFGESDHKLLEMESESFVNEQLSFF